MKTVEIWKGVNRLAGFGYTTVMLKFGEFPKDFIPLEKIGEIEFDEYSADEIAQAIKNDDIQNKHIRRAELLLELRKLDEELEK